jgi:TatD DNase family protein
MPVYFDSHCHIHWPDYEIGQSKALKNAHVAGLAGMICVGTNFQDSEQAIAFAQKHRSVWASAGLHPHDAKKGLPELNNIQKLLGSPKIVAVGECGLDYFYSKSSKKDQAAALKFQIELALQKDLPIIFHIRDAFDDFWPVFDKYSGIKGVFHSFTASKKELDRAIERNMHIGLNGIITFSKQKEQLEVAKAVPLDKLLIETDAPFLSPPPKRGQTNEPANVTYIARFLSELRQEPLDKLVATSTNNAKVLFNLPPGDINTHASI